MSRRTGLIGAGLGTFIFFLIVFLPADVAIRLLAPESTRASGVSGTLWGGSVTSAEIGGLRLGVTTWRLSPLQLLLGRLAADVDATIGEAEASGSLAVGLGGALTCTECRFDGPAIGLRPLLPALKLLDGMLQLDLDVLDLRDGWPVRLVANAKLLRVPITMAGAAVVPATPRGDFEASVNAAPVPEDGVVIVAVKDAGGPLELTGNLRLTPPGNYEFSGRARARPDAPAELANALSVLGPRTADGGSELSAAGSF